MSVWLHEGRGELGQAAGCRSSIAPAPTCGSWLVVAFGVAIGLAVCGATGCATTGSTSAPAWKPPAALPMGNSPVRGPADAMVRIVEFSDFQCPFSAKVQATLEELEKAFPGDLQFVYKHFPMPNHAQAAGAAMGAADAADQGGFWKLQPVLFANPSALEPEDIGRYAGELGLDGARVRQAIGSATMKAQLYADKAVGERLGVRGTPTFFINGRRFVGAKPIGEFRAVVAEELEKAKAMRERGIPKREIADLLTELNLAAAPAEAEAPKGPQRPVADEIIYPADTSSEHFAVGMPEDQTLVTMVVFIDYECPFSARLDGDLPDLLARFRGKLRVVYRHLPLEMHKNARLAALASLAANEQGFGLQYHRRLLENQTELKQADLIRHAMELGLDPARVEAAIGDGRHDAVVDADLQAAKLLKTTGTPTTFINGRKVVGAVGSAALTGVIEQELARATAAQQRLGLNGRPLFLHLIGKKPAE